jgi:2-dehydro-3-deoxygalactonokinase
MEHFLSCDWGTSSFRLKLIEADTLQTVGEVQNNCGIAATPLDWQKGTGAEDRFIFFASVIASAIGEVERKTNRKLSGVPVILSGMASSSLGMIQMPYKQLPFKTDGSDLKVERVEASKKFDHDVFIISGVCSETDVMRGEETQIVGIVDPLMQAEGWYILPGTHSKHIHVRNNVAFAFQTYMTGELFALLSNSSTLTQAVAGGGESDDDKASFVQGVKDSIDFNLLSRLFRVRTRFLLDELPAPHNRNYLSGLLIGTEVKDLKGKKPGAITVVSSNIGEHYKTAIQTLNIDVPLSIRSDHDVTVRGQYRIFANHRG